MQQGRRRGRSIFLPLVIGLLLTATIQPALAAEGDVPIGFAQYLQIESSEQIKDGQIVVIENGKYILATKPYAHNLEGVVVFKPGVAISSVGHGGNIQPVLSKGTANVLVSNSNGAIEVGDFITSSETAGIGMKATQSGFVLGIAQAPFSSGTGSDTTALIPVAIDIKFTTGSEQSPLTPRAFASQILNALTIGLRAVSSEPSTALRYAAAALVVIVSIVFGFLIFGRAATNGIVAVGRNPLAKKSIFVMVLFNIALTIGFALIGLVVALFILAA